MTGRRGCANSPLQDSGYGFIGFPQAQVILQVCGDLTVSVEVLAGGETHVKRATRARVIKINGCF